MAATLPGMPAEILYMVIEKVSTSSLQRVKHRYLDSRILAFESLRATCRELNAKTLPFFGFMYFRELAISSKKGGMEKLLTIATSRLGSHLVDLHVSTSDLIDQTATNYASEGTDDERGSWVYSDSGEPVHVKYEVAEDVVDFHAGGQCADMLAQSMTGVPNLKNLRVQAPYSDTVGPGPKHRALLIHHWTAIAKIFISGILAKSNKLEKMFLKGPFQNIPVRLSVLETMYSFRQQLRSLRYLKVELEVDESSRMLDLNILIQY